jgi:hypothetical protein
MRIKITFTEELLGTASGNPEIHEEFIATRSADAAKAKEEMEALPAEALVEKSMTVFPRSPGGLPILWDYQVKGFIKEAAGVYIELHTKEIKIGKTKLSKYTYKRVVDNFVFVSPRQIVLDIPDGCEIGECQRPLRADTMRGERIALAHSETVPAGTKCVIEIECMHDALVPVVEWCLDYGSKKGIGQWRNSGKGRFGFMGI